mmetsp:Transcript_12094/g.25764  ORF Transcript_12094/g.25764 Transcript_12094/m.25764 type:complete len:598 (-) Transcript_12094:420-2213(-)|eukprot:CAMPEP_0183710612 /NCGR_PEP_ID=MMETSP0737-20130205/6306_1 /TAXON_ID=385413 /ORGANISM="Thalassiosira miniscula, Strain CCMP1093" /LENGTH=597 /DNA_ID=CAMNT_0025938921 /DNA_START=767 /DNA_END=2560 /DNA_ORIENTATION=-
MPFAKTSNPVKKAGLGGYTAPHNNGHTTYSNNSPKIDSGISGLDASLASRARIHSNYHARLAFVDPTLNSDKYYILQLLQDEPPPKKPKKTKVLAIALGTRKTTFLKRNSCSSTEDDDDCGIAEEYHVYTRWGRTGSSGQAKLEGPFDDENDASAVFERIFKSKTGIAWKDAVAGEEPKPGKYMYLSLAPSTANNQGSGGSGNNGDDNDNAQWYYYTQNDPLGKLDGWYEYDIVNNAEVENLYKIFLASSTNIDSSQSRLLAKRMVTSDSSGFQYLVDLLKMTQTNTITGRVRPIQRTVDGRSPRATPQGVAKGTAAVAARSSSSKHTTANGTANYTAIRGALVAASVSPIASIAASASPQHGAGWSQTAATTLIYTAPQHLTSGIPADALGVPPITCDMDNDCVICHDHLKASPAVALSVCGHVFHEDCIQQAFRSKPQCPVCRVSIGKPQGKSPSGTMTTTISPTHCSGYFNVDSIIITYNIPRGKQRSYHEHPNKFHGGKYVVAYLPNSMEGRDLLKRLKYAFLHGLSFTIGTSITTGLTDQCTWTSIHHKTSPSGGTRAYGYPDPNYFENCNGELDGLGVPSAQELHDHGGTI